MIKLIIKKKNVFLAEKKLEDRPLTIGSSTGAEIRLPSKTVDPEHALVSILGGRVLIEDQDSKSGTLVNGEKIEDAFLEPGDVIQIGSFTLEVESLGTASKIERDKTDSYTEDDTASFSPQRKNPVVSEFLKDDLPGPKTEDYEESKVAPLADTKSFPEITDSPEIEEDDTRGKISPKNIDREIDKKLSHASDLAGRDGKTISLTLGSGPRLHPLTLESGGKFIPLEKDEMTVGRAEGCFLTIEHRSVSAKHALIINVAGKISVIDQDSTNGTTVNGEPIRERALRCHDVIAFGDIKFEFLEGPVEPLGQSRDYRPSYVDDDFLSDFRTGDSINLKRPRESKRPLLYLTALVFLAVLAVYYVVFEYKPEKPPVGTTPEDTIVKIDKAQSETQRLILHNLERAKNLMKEKRFAEARKVLKLINDRIDPGNMEALKLLAQIDDIETAQEQKAQQERLRRQERAKTVAALLAKGKKALSNNDYITAKKSFSEILQIESGNETARKYLDRSIALEKRILKEREQLSKKAQQVEAYYFQGISYYEEGNYEEAAEVLRKVVAFRSSSYYNSASGILAEIEQKQMMDIEEQLSEVDSLLKSEEMLKAENVVKAILRRYPDSKKAKKIYRNIHGEILAKAKKVYSEGLVYEQVVEDTKSAIESYEEVLRLLPNPKEEYHKKAKMRLRKLK